MEAACRFTVNIVEEGIDVAVRIGHLADAGFAAIKVGAVRRVVCGSPCYFEKYGVPTTPADLKNHRIAASTSAWASPEWWFADDERVTIDSVLQCNTNEAVIEVSAVLIPPFRFWREAGSSKPLRAWTYDDFRAYA